MTARDMDRVFAINIRAVHLCYKYAAKHMIKQGTGGKLIAAASLAAFRGSSTTSAYVASKVGLFLGWIEAYHTVLTAKANFLVNPKLSLRSEATTKRQPLSLPNMVLPATVMLLDLVRSFRSVYSAVC